MKREGYLVFAGRTILYWETGSEWISAVQVEPAVLTQAQDTLARALFIIAKIAKTF